MKFRDAPKRAQLFVFALIGLAVVLYLNKPPSAADQARAEIEAIAKKQGLTVDQVLAIHAMDQEAKRLDRRR